MVFVCPTIHQYKTNLGHAASKFITFQRCLSCFVYFKIATNYLKTCELSWYNRIVSQIQQQINNIFRFNVCAGKYGFEVLNNNKIKEFEWPKMAQERKSKIRIFGVIYNGTIANFLSAVKALKERQE